MFLNDQDKRNRFRQVISRGGPASPARGKKILRFSVIGFFAWTIFSLVAGGNGFLKLLSLKREAARTRVNITRLEVEIDRLDREVELLESIPEHRKNTLRSRHRYKKENELVFEFVEPADKH